VVEVDGLPPAKTERPETEKEVARLLRDAARSGRAVIPIGGGRLLGMGNRPQRFDIALDMTGLDQVIERSEHDMTVSVQAGVRLDDLNKLLGETGQHLPLDPFGGPGHTIGGLLATGFSGPLRLRYGSPRDFLIGLRVALPDGTLASSGGRVVKNVSGYDMNKLHFGALGSLGVIVAASFKVFPRPLHEVTLERRSQTPEADVEDALRLRMTPHALEVSSAGRVLARIAGTQAAVNRVAAELGWPEAKPDVWEKLARQTSDRWARVAVPQGALRDVIRALPEGAGWWASAAVGTLHWFDFDPDALPRVRQVAEAAGGSLVVIAAPPKVKERLDAWGTAPATLEVMGRIRNAFDPKRTLSPGRYVV
jgi:glycolate oxidase FAD binding subunit